MRITPFEQEVSPLFEGPGFSLRDDGRQPRRSLPAPIIIAGFVAAIAIAAGASVWKPSLALAIPLAIALVVLLSRRVDLAAMLMIACTPFDRYLTLYVSHSAFKAVGFLLLLSFAINRYRSPPASNRQPLAVAIAVFLVLMLVATAVHPNGAEGLSTVQRYLSFGLTGLVLISVLQRELSPQRAVAAYTYASTVAAGFALYNFLSGGSTRASGPIDDPNDLAYILVAAIPFALWLSARYLRWAHLLFALVLAGGAAATLSRGAAIAAIAMFALALWRGHIPVGALLGGLVAVVIAVPLTATLAPSVLNTALTQKQYIATYNVDTRALRWHGALLMTFSHPLTGVGPAGFRQNYLVVSGHAEPAEPTPVSHDMYLEVSSELGVPALLAFLAMLGLAWRSAGAARLRSRAEASSLASATQISLLGILTASIFLTEQYFLTLWIVLALSAALLGRAESAQRKTTPAQIARNA